MSAVMHFPGIDGVFSGTLSIGHGIQPAIATIQIPISTEINEPVGDLTLEAPDFELVLPECRVDKIQKTANETFLVTIFDRRWKWRFGQISGVYNLRQPDGELDPDLETEPQDIATDCLKAMGETGFDVGELPNRTRPEYRWVAQNPAAMLDQLCQSLGCSVVLGFDNRVTIRRLGEGGELPENPLKDGSVVHDFPIVPDEVSVISGPRSIEAIFELRAVGFEEDGTKKKIDDLSYAPREGWIFETPRGSYYVLQDEKHRELAKKHLYRDYEIVREASLDEDSDLILDGQVFEFGNFSARKLKHLKFYDETNQTELSDEDDAASRPARSEVTGMYYSGRHKLKNFSGKVRVPHSFDADKALVTFNEPVYILEESFFGTGLLYRPAKLFLKCRCELLEDRTGHRLRYEWKKPTGGRTNDTEPQFEHRFDIIPKTTAKYRDVNQNRDRPRLIDVENNDTEIENDLDKHADAVIDGYRIVPGETKTWVGWHQNFAIDGAIRQVSYTFGEQGWFTTANRNAEMVNVRLNTLPQMRQMEQVKQQGKAKSVIDEVARELGLA